MAGEGIKKVPNLPKFRWNSKAKRYIAPNGRFVPVKEIRGALDRFLVDATRIMGEFSQSLTAGELSLAQWQAEMMILSKDVNLAGAALERGGWFQMSAKDFGSVGDKVKGEYRFLRNFAGEIESGAQKLDGTLARRARLYGRQGRVTYYDFARASSAAAGFDQERSVLTPAESCEPCISQDRKGWQPIGSLIPIGSRQCLSNCRCFMRFRNSKTREVRTI